jgi:hypothetical protein
MIHRIDDVPTLVKALRSHGAWNSSRHFAGADKDRAGQRTVDEFIEGMTKLTDIATFVSYPVVFTNWNSNITQVEGSSGE